MDRLKGATAAAVLVVGWVTILLVGRLRYDQSWGEALLVATVGAPLVYLLMRLRRRMSGGALEAGQRMRRRRRGEHA